MIFRTAVRRTLDKELREQMIDDLLDAYLSWREESMTVRETYEWCQMKRGHDAGLAYHACLAALDREEWAARVYALSVERAAGMFGTAPQSCPR